MQRGRPKKELTANIVKTKDVDIIEKQIEVEMLSTNLRIFGKRLVAGCVYSLSTNEFNELLKDYKDYFILKGKQNG